MRAVILAAGFGRRMMPLTADTHKCLLEIAGRPVLTRIIDALTEHDIYDITIVSGYRADDLREFMKDNFPECNVQWVHNERYDTTNNIYSLALALDQVDNQDIILIESDLVFEPGIISRLVESPHDAVAMVSRYEAGMDGTVVSMSSDVITAIHPPHLQGEDFTFGNKFKTLNIYKFSARFVHESLKQLTAFYAKSVNDNCYYELVLGVMIYMQSTQIFGIVVDTKLWSEIDDPVDVQVTEYKFNPSKRLTTLDTTHGAYWNYPVEDFCYVQNAYFPNEGMISMIRHHLPDLIKAFGSSQPHLDRKLSYFLECDAAKAVLISGSCQLFPWLRGHLGAKKILIPTPTFGEYPRNFPNANTYDDKVGVDEKSLEKAIEANDAIVFVNPNNPTGTAIATNYIIDLSKKNPGKLFIVDESFIDFSEQQSIIDYLKSNAGARNIMLLKSLGKSLGVPGLRLGYVYSNDEAMLAEIRNWLPIWNINSVSEYFLELLLKNRKYLDASFGLVKRDRLQMAEKLSQLPFVEKVFPSQANFLLARLKKSASPNNWLAERLLEEHNIYVKDISSKMADGSAYYRFAVRKAEHNELLLKALHHVCKRAEVSI